MTRHLATKPVRGHNPPILERNQPNKGCPIHRSASLLLSGRGVHRTLSTRGIPTCLPCCLCGLLRRARSVVYLRPGRLKNSIPFCALRNRLTKSYWASSSQAPIRSCISEQWPNIAFRPYEFSRRNLRAVQTAATSLTTRRYSSQRYVRLEGTGAGDLLSRNAQKIGNRPPTTALLKHPTCQFYGLAGRTHSH